jgi:ribose transport system substrate-binding protein
LGKGGFIVFEFLRRSPAGRAKLIVLLGVSLVSLSAIVTGCGGGGSSSSTNADGASSPSASPPSGSKQVQAAERIVSEAEAEPTKIGVTVPLKSTPPTGKTLVWLNCDFEQCQVTGEALEEAVKPLGWTLKKINFKADEPATLVAAFQQALQYDPVGVALNGTPYSEWSSVFPEYERAGVPIVEGLAGPQEAKGPFVANLWEEVDLGVDAKMLANWVTAESGGEGEAVVLGVPEFPILSGFATDFEKSLSESCAGCSADIVNATIAQVTSSTGGNSALVSALQKNPSAEFVITCDGALSAGLAAAISGAGIEGKKIGGALGTLENQTEIVAGKEDAFTGQNFGYYGWLLLDSILRSSEGMEIPPGDGGMPHQLLTANNITEPSASMKAPVGYQKQFEELWKVG